VVVVILVGNARSWCCCCFWLDIGDTKVSPQSRAPRRTRKYRVVLGSACRLVFPKPVLCGDIFYVRPVVALRYPAWSCFRRRACLERAGRRQQVV
jgi:hypothetical protein